MPVNQYPIFNLLLYILLIGVYIYPIYFKRRIVPHAKADAKLNFVFFFIAVTLFCTFGFPGDDFAGYANVFNSILRTGKNSHFEPVYVWLINNVTPIYYVWRFIVWGGATLLLLMGFRRLGLQSVSSYAAITVFYLTTLYFMRGNLGVSIMFYGLTFLLVPYRKIKGVGYFLGVLIICCSYFFHKSMLISLALLVPAFFITFNRKVMLCSWVLFPLAVYGISYALDYMMKNGLGASDMLISRYSQHYASTAHFEANWNGILFNTFQYGASFFTIYAVYRYNLATKLPYAMKFFFNYWYIWVYIALACNFQEIGGWYFPRFMYMSNLPWAVFMAYLYQSSKNTKYIRIITLWAAVGSLYMLCYSIYKSALI